MLSCYSPENLQISIFKFKIFKPKPNLPMFKSTGEDASLMTVVDDIQGDDYDPWIDLQNWVVEFGLKMEI